MFYINNYFQITIIFILHVVVVFIIIPPQPPEELPVITASQLLLSQCLFARPLSKSGLLPLRRINSNYIL